MLIELSSREPKLDSVFEAGFASMRERLRFARGTAGGLPALEVRRAINWYAPWSPTASADAPLPHAAAWAQAESSLQLVLENLKAAAPWAESRLCGSAGDGGGPGGRTGAASGTGAAFMM